MAINRLLDDAAFDAAAVKVITTAFDDIVRELRLDRTGPAAEIIALNILRYAHEGERDPARLKDLATKFLRE